jgi:RNA polymerase sigma-70 factor (ECF subfamily)
MPVVHERRTEDARLVTASRAGDPAAFGALFAHWFDPCVDVAWRALRDRDAAADVAQDVFLAGSRTLDQPRGPGAFGGWAPATPVSHSGVSTSASSRTWAT